MTKIYSSPLIEVHPITPLSMLCESGASDRVSSDIGLHGGDQSGNVANAF